MDLHTILAYQSKLLHKTVKIYLKTKWSRKVRTKSIGINPQAIDSRVVNNGLDRVPVLIYTYSLELSEIDQNQFYSWVANQFRKRSNNEIITNIARNHMIQIIPIITQKILFFIKKHNNNNDNDEKLKRIRDGKSDIEIGPRRNAQQRTWQCCSSHLYISSNFV